MNIFSEKHQQLLYDLLKGGIEFILIGGYAVIYHGYKRTTGDMDIWLKPTNENKNKLLTLLKKLEFDPMGINYIANLDFTKIIAFHFWEEPERVDFITKISGVTFDEAFSQKEISEIEGIKVPFLNFKHLISSKITSERLKDKADIEELQKIKKFKNKKS
jgi:hypothetical protein